MNPLEKIVPPGVDYLKVPGPIYSEETPMEGVSEYCEEMEVTYRVADGVPLVWAKNEGGYNSTAVDLRQLIAWVKQHKPELLL